MNKRHTKRFAKLIAIITIWQGNPEWDQDVAEESFIFAEQLAKRYNFPDGWHRLGDYEQAKAWYKKHCM